MNNRISEFRYSRSGQHFGLTLLEVLVAVGIIALLIAIILPGILYERERARRMQCSGNLKMLALAVHNYHDVYLSFPQGGTPFLRTGDHANRYSVFLVLLPFLESNSLYDSFMNDGANRGPWDIGNNDLWTRYEGINSHFRCPADPYSMTKAHEISRTNYRISLGDWPDRGDQTDVPNPRGLFSLRRNVYRKLGSISDGTSNTIMFSEAVVSHVPGITRGGIALGIDHIPKLDEKPDEMFAVNSCLEAADSSGKYVNGITSASDRIGYRWADSHVIYTGFSTIVPPNGPSCSSAYDARDTDNDNINIDSEIKANFTSMITAGSNHGDGAYIALADGSVRYVSSTINALNDDYSRFNPCVTAGPSPFGVWGALGSINGGETAKIP